MKRKALIVTVYNSENFGSFLQAFALKTVLEREGFDVAFFKRNPRGTSHDFGKHLIYMVNYIIRFKFLHVYFVLSQWTSFEKNIKMFSIYDKKSNYYRNTEIVIVGSDTIWNFDNKYFKNKKEIYLGTIFPEKRVISYAASVANTSRNEFESIIKNNGYLNNLSHILVRDTYTKSLVECCSTKKAELVCDPTLLLKKEDYQELEFRDVRNYPFILLYYFNDLPHKIKMRIIEYAKVNKMKIISAPVKREWCDESVIADPQMVLSCFRDASAVITNTFHGCAFSMIYQKSFAVYNDSKNKVIELLMQYDEKDRLFMSSEKMISQLGIPFVGEINGNMETKRKKSMALLHSALNNESRGIV